MGLFGGKKTKEEHFEGTLGIDIGTGGIKIVELVPDKGRIKLSTYGYSEFAHPTPNPSSLLDSAEVSADVIVRVLKEGGFKANRAVAALPSANVFHAIITLPVPKSAKEELKPLIEAQARKLLPLPLEEMILDSHILDKDLLPTDDKHKKEEETPEASLERRKNIRVLLTGAPKSVVQKYIDLFRAAKIELASLETETFAAIRSLVGKDKSRIMMVDIGAERTNIAIVDSGVPYITRVVKMGGDTITQTLAAGMGITFEDAETMKRDLTYKTDESIAPPLQSALQPLVHELKYAIQLYADQEFHDNKTVEKVILTGGSAHLAGLDPYLTQELNVNVYVGDPWARIAAPTEAKEVLEEVGPRLSVAIGLAMRTKED